MIWFPIFFTSGTRLVSNFWAPTYEPLAFWLFGELLGISHIIYKATTAG